MADYGLLSTGFVIKPMDVVASEVDDSLKGILGESAGTEADGSIPLDTAAGQLKTLISDAVGGLWELLQQVYASFNPTTAVDAGLDALCALTGTIRLGQGFSTVTATCTGTPATVIPVGRVATVTGSGSRFDSQAQDTIASATAWAPTTVYTAGTIRTSNSKIYVCITGGTSDATGPATEELDIVDNTVHWKFVGNGTGYVNILFKAEISGPIGAAVGALNTISTTVSGWSSVNNLSIALVGAIQETNTALRRRREQELSASGSSTAGAITAAILRCSTDVNNPVTACTVNYNDTDITVDSIPPHSIEALVTGGPNADITAAIFRTLAAGIGTYGSTTVSVTDVAGNSHDVHFNRPTEVPIYVRADVEYDPALFPDSGGDDDIKGAILTFGAGFPIGKSVRSSALEAAIFDGPVSVNPGAAPVPGILDVSILYISTSPTPTVSTTITITRRQLATFDSANITVNSTEGAP